MMGRAVSARASLVSARIGCWRWVGRPRSFTHLRTWPEVGVEPLFEACNGTEVRECGAFECSVEAVSGDLGFSCDGAGGGVALGLECGAEALGEDLSVACAGGGVVGEGAVGPCAGGDVVAWCGVSSGSWHVSIVGVVASEIARFGPCYSDGGSYRNHRIGRGGRVRWSV